MVHGDVGIDTMANMQKVCARRAVRSCAHGGPYVGCLDQVRRLMKGDFHRKKQARGLVRSQITPICGEFGTPGLFGHRLQTSMTRATVEDFGSNPPVRAQKGQMTLGKASDGDYRPEVTVRTHEGYEPTVGRLTNPANPCPRHPMCETHTDTQTHRNTEKHSAHARARTHASTTQPPLRSRYGQAFGDSRSNVSVFCFCCAAWCVYVLCRAVGVCVCVGCEIVFTVYVASFADNAARSNRGDRTRSTAYSLP